MPVTTEMNDGRCHCRISGALSIWEAADIWRVLNPLLQSAQPLVLDFSAVNACDGAGIQILCQIDRSRQRAADTLCITGVSDILLAAMHQAGLNGAGLNGSQGEND